MIQHDVESGPGINLEINYVVVADPLQISLISRWEPGAKSLKLK